MNKLVLSLCLSLSISTAALGQDLPTFGDRASGILSPQKEKEIGESLLRQLRRSTPMVNDPLIIHYCDTLVHHLASYSDIANKQISLVILKSPQLNAFAAPGNIMGIHAGLFLHASAEGELSSVIAHELAHLSQRHFSRRLEEAQRRSIPNLAAIAAGILLVAAGEAQAGQAAISTTIASNLDNQLAFSRENEREADNLGIKTLVNANIDPQSMPHMFERMLASQKFTGRRPPPFLITHPLTEERISSAQDRASQYPTPQDAIKDTLEYQLTKARIRVLLSKKPAKLVSLYQSSLNKAKTDRQKSIARYGYAISLLANNQASAAEEAFAPLLTRNPHFIYYIATQAEILIKSNQLTKAAKLIEKELDFSPGNYPLTYRLVQTYHKQGKHKQSVQQINTMLEKRPHDHHLWFLLAEYRGLAKDIIGVHLARAEYFQLLGQRDKSMAQLELALKKADQQAPMKARIQQKIQQIKDREKDK